MKKLSHKDRLKFFEENIHSLDKRNVVLEDISKYTHNFKFENALCCLIILTKALITDNSSPYERLNFDFNITKQLRYSIADFKNKERHEGSDDKYSEPNNGKVYLRQVESLLDQVDLDFSESKKKDKFFTLLECFNYIKPCRFIKTGYDGDILKISSVSNFHKQSISILPKNSGQAVTLLYGDCEPRVTFAEYDNIASAETFVQNYYGTDGLFAEHYNSFLDYRSKYPKQKRLLQY